MNALQTDAADAAATLGKFLRAHAVYVLNVAGPRASEWPDGYPYASAALVHCIAEGLIA